VSTDERMVLPMELREAHSELIKLAAELVRGMGSPYDDGQFYVSTPKVERRRIVSEIDRYDEQHKLWGIRLREIADKLPRQPLARAIHHVTVCRNCVGGD